MSDETELRWRLESLSAALREALEERDEARKQLERIRRYVKSCTEFGDELDGEDIMKIAKTE